MSAAKANRIRELLAELPATRSSPTETQIDGARGMIAAAWILVQTGPIDENVLLGLLWAALEGLAGSEMEW